MEPDNKILECGCEQFKASDGKIVWIHCNEHEVDVYEESRRPIQKYRKLWRESE